MAYTTSESKTAIKYFNFLIWRCGQSSPACPNLPHFTVPSSNNIYFHRKKTLNLISEIWVGLLHPAAWLG